METKYGFRGAILLFMLLVSLAGCVSPKAVFTPGIPGQSATLALVNGTLIDGTGTEPVPEAVILIAGDKILAAGPLTGIDIPKGVRTIDAGGAAILPGFINAHVHNGFNKANLQAWAEGGVTTVRDESAMPEQIAQLKAFRAEVGADPHYARLVSSGTIITIPGGYGHLFVSSPEDARKKVFEELDGGADGIKVSLEDGYAGTHGLPKLTPEELKVIVEAAHERGTLVSGHITQRAYLQSMIEAGVDDIAHLPYDHVPQEGFQQMVEKGNTSPRRLRCTGIMGHRLPRLWRTSDSLLGWAAGWRWEMIMGEARATLSWASRCLKSRL